jgi:O-acetyl-ADP-ribose deacetylase (regulator of RNase III)
MLAYKEIKGDLIALAEKGMFDVIAHGCNCFCRMKRGIAPQMAKKFGCDKYELELKYYSGDVNKLGMIDYELKPIQSGRQIHVVNCYTQYDWSTYTKPLDYDALTMCMKKINHAFKGDIIGLPQIGCGLAGGDWNRVKAIIQKELKDCDVTVVIYNK